MFEIIIAMSIFIVYILSTLCFIIWRVVRRIALYEISSRNIFGAL